MDDSTEIGPLARKDLADELHKQLDKSVKKGAKIETGGKQEDAFYEPTVLTGVKPGMPAFDEETFGPVAAIIRAKDVDEAFELAADSKYGLGLTLFTSDIENGRRHIGKKPDRAVFINEPVRFYIFTIYQRRSTAEPSAEFSSVLIQHLKNYLHPLFCIQNRIVKVEPFPVIVFKIKLPPCKRII